MEQVFEYTIPQLHPLLVHFPLALLLLAAGVVLVWALTDGGFWLRAGTLLSGLGAIGALLALRSGEAMEDDAAGAPLVDALLPLHEQAAEWTVWMAFALAALLIAVLFGSDRLWAHRPNIPLPVRLGVLLLAVLVAALVAWTGHIGGVMVWGVPR